MAKSFEMSKKKNLIEFQLLIGSFKKKKKIARQIEKRKKNLGGEKTANRQ